MSKTDYEQKLADIQAVPAEKTLEPNMPVATALQEAEDLHEWCQEDKETLIKADLNWSLVDDLPARAGACRFIQSIWVKDSMTKEEAQKEWALKAPIAFTLRDDLNHHFFRAFRNAPELYAKTQNIAEGSSNADMIQDLSDQAVLGKANLPYLQAINMDLTMLDQAETLSAEMASLLAKSNGERMAGKAAEEKILRDKAYSLVKEAVDEIRDAGKYAFIKNEAKYKGYISKYFKAHKESAKDSSHNSGIAK